MYASLFFANVEKLGAISNRSDWGAAMLRPYKGKNGGQHVVQTRPLAVLFRAILRWEATAMVALNPQVMDFMVAARGYSLGLAGLAVAMYEGLTGLHWRPSMDYGYS
jgi:hypothetical protein